MCVCISIIIVGVKDRKKPEGQKSSGQNFLYTTPDSNVRYLTRHIMVLVSWKYCTTSRFEKTVLESIAYEQIISKDC